MDKEGALAIEDAHLVAPVRLGVRVPAHVLVRLSDENRVGAETIEFQKSLIDADESPLPVLPENAVTCRLKDLVQHKLFQLLVIIGGAAVKDRGIPLQVPHIEELRAAIFSAGCELAAYMDERILRRQAQTDPDDVARARMGRCERGARPAR